MPKKRAMITVDAEQWDRLQGLFRDQGYPPNSMSVYLSACLDRLEWSLTGNPEYDCQDPCTIVDIYGLGLKEAGKKRGFKVVEDDE